MIDMTYMAFWKQGKCPYVTYILQEQTAGLSTTFEIAGKSF